MRNIKNISSIIAFDMCQNKNNILIDVRSEVEWCDYGIPKINNSQLLLLSIYISPNMLFNQNFIQELLIKLEDKHELNSLFFICRLGKRSYEAANLISQFLKNDLYNIEDGYMGWKNNNLPWLSL
jgi:rhodanese-related sulfurtransferase